MFVYYSSQYLGGRITGYIYAGVLRDMCSSDRDLVACWQFDTVLKAALRHTARRQSPVGSPHVSETVCRATACRQEPRYGALP
jgi:hypothetical protein